MIEQDIWSFMLVVNTGLQFPISLSGALDQNIIRHEKRMPAYSLADLVALQLHHAFHAPVDQSAQITRTG